MFENGLDGGESCNKSECRSVAKVGLIGLIVKLVLPDHVSIGSQGTNKDSI